MGYAGDILAKDCYNQLKSDKAAQLIDVRTMAEWSFIGIPDLNAISKRPHLIEWVQFPSQTMNENFTSNLNQRLEELKLEKDVKLYFLCRSGSRSQAAAQIMTAHGYSNCYNVSHGFEGDLNELHHRGEINGWKFDKLPWAQQ